MPKTITFKYLNHRGVVSERTVDVEALEFIREPAFGYQSGWFIMGFCHHKKATRSFALNRIILDLDTVPRLYTLIRM